MIVHIVVRPDHAAFRATVERLGLLPAGLPFTDEEVVDYLGHFYEFVAEDGPYTITPEYASETVRRFFDTSGPYARHAEGGQPALQLRGDPAHQPRPLRHLRRPAGHRELAAPGRGDLALRGRTALDAHGARDRGLAPADIAATSRSAREHRHARRMGGPRRRGRVARLHADGDLRRQRTRDRRPGRGTTSSSTSTAAATSTPSRRCGSRRSATACRSSTRRCGTSSTGSPTPPCSATGTGSPSSSPRRSPAVVPVRRPALPVRLRRRRRGRAGPQDRLPVLDQPGRWSAARATWPSAAPTTATPSGRISLGAGGFGTDVFDPLRFPALRAPGYDDADWADTAVALVDAHHRRARRRGGRAARAGRRRHGDHRAGGGAPPRRGVRRARRARDRPTRWPPGFGRTGTLFATEQCGIEPRPDDHRQGPHRRLPADGRHRGQRPGLRGVPRPRPRRAHPLPRALLQRERARRRRGPAPPAARRRVGRAGQRARPRRAAR